jgi:hypothetical protein
MEYAFGKRGLFPISLGFNCHVKVYIQMLGEIERIGYMRQPFDWIGLSMCSLCQIVKSNYANFVSKDTLELRQRFVKDERQYMTNTKYNCVFMHDFGKNTCNISDTQFTEIEEDYTRRVQRWKATIESGKHILFIRLEMDEKERVAYPGFSQEDDVNEKKYLEEFAQLMLEKNIRFTILHLTQKYETSYDVKNRICYVKFEQLADVKTIGANEIDGIIRKNLSHIRSSIANI